MYIVIIFRILYKKEIMGKLVIGIVLFLMGQALIWVQTNGQFVWAWSKENPFWMAAIFSMPISYMKLAY